MHLLAQKDKGNGAGKTQSEGEELQSLRAFDFKQMWVCMSNRGNTSTVYKFLCLYDIDVTLMYILERREMETSVLCVSMLG